MRALALLIPIAVAFLCALALTSWLAEPEGFWATIVRWLAIAVASTLVLLAMQRLMRRLLPLAALYSLSLYFPDSAPPRFAVALRSGTTRSLERALERGPDALSDVPSEAATQLLELVAALSRHDRLTRGHSERVRAYSRMLGEELGFDDDQIDSLHWAGLVHDVGKIGVPQEVLNKPGSLTADEFETIKTHTVIGQRITEGLESWLGDAVHAVWQHHERYEGGGYPSGMPASSLPIYSRVVCVADAFDVMTSARSYKQPMPAAKARAELERNAGTQFDPTVVRAMMNISLGSLWRTMGPLSLVAQIRLFPRRVLQGGAVVSAVLAALLGLGVTVVAAGLPGGGEASGVDADAAAEAESGPGGSPDGPPASFAPPDPTPVATPTPPPSAATTTPSTTSTSTTSTTTTSTTTSTSVTVTTSTPAAASTAAPTVAPTTRPATVVTTAAPTTPAPVSTTTPTAPPSTAPVTPTRFTLASSAPGPVASQAVLPFLVRAPINDVPVPNYDTDRNADAGLTVQRSTAGLAGPDGPALQRWSTTIPAAVALRSARLEIWLGAASAGPDPILVAAVGLYDCGADGCVLIGQDITPFAGPVGGFVGVAFDLSPSATVTVAAGRNLELRVAVLEGSSADALVAYDTIEHPATLTLTTV